MTAFSSSNCATVEPSLPCCSCLCNSSLYAAAFFLHVHKPHDVLPHAQDQQSQHCFMPGRPEVTIQNKRIPIKLLAVWKVSICASAAREQ